MQVGRIALLEADVCQAEVPGARSSRRDQVACDVDTEDVGAQLSLGYCGGAVAATEVEDLEPDR